jgi:hypothetical protein
MRAPQALQWQQALMLRQQALAVSRSGFAARERRT